MKKRSLSKDWTLCSDGFNGKVDLPNDYTIKLKRDPKAPGGASTGYFLGGNGMYTKEIELGDGRYILDIDGAYMCSYVSLNEKKLTMHPHGYTPILLDLSRWVKKNDINKLAIKTHAYQCSTRWYSGAGLYRDVFLWEGGDIRIEPRDVFVTTPTLDGATAAYEISADRDADVLLIATAFDADDRAVNTAECKLPLKSGTKTSAELKLFIRDAHTWSPDTPYLYTLRTEIYENGACVETDTRTFGIRTVEVSAENGLLVNGKPEKLRGGCIHHEHGVLGAAEYKEACLRKLTRLKAAGFNAIRSAHNPPSTTLLEICDRIGLYVMDEAFDCWSETKGGEFNYHMWFDDWWQRDIEAMVKRDRAYPCVISFSIGNEIPESAGFFDGGEWSERLSNEVRRYDNTRLVTSPTWQMGGKDKWEERTRDYFAPHDICGYNYMYTRYEKDHEMFPERVIWGSETHAITFYDSWKSVLDNKYVIGDFTWTAWDNIGEAGTGRALWARDGEIKGISLAEYPWRTCFQGDFDLCGYRRPQSYFREAIWKGITEPKIFTTHPEHYGEGYTGTGWHWYDVLDSWTFDDSYLGKPVKCEVYSVADEIQWFVNGRSLGTSVPEKAIATMDIPYEKGEISVIAYKDGRKCGRSSLKTVGKPTGVKVVAEDMPKGSNIFYYDIYVVDENGDRVPCANNELECTTEAGELLGIFSGCPNNEDEYGTNKCHAFEGRAVAIVKGSGVPRVVLGN